MLPDCRPWIRWEDLVLKRALKGTIFEIHRVVEDGTRRILHEEVDGGFVADILPGETYVLMERPAPPVRAAYRLMHRLHASRVQLDALLPGLYKRICWEIMCLPDFRSAFTIYERLQKPGPNGEPGLGPDELSKLQEAFPIGRESIGGWGPGPGGVCEFCRPDIVAPGGDEDDGEEDDGGGSGTLHPPADPCGRATELAFHADFEADTLLLPPAMSPPGAPAGDSFQFSGGNGFATVQNSAALGSKATRLERTGTPDPDEMKCVIAGDPVKLGTVCIQYSAALLSTHFLQFRRPRTAALLLVRPRRSHRVIWPRR